MHKDLPGRILMTTDTIGGVWTYSLELTRALGKFDIEVGLATMGHPLSPEQKENAAGIANLKLFESTYKLEWMNDPWDDVREAGKWLLELERFFNPQIIHLNGYAHGHLSWRSAVLVVGHSCVLSWWDSVKRECAPDCWDVYRREVSKGLAAADFVVAPTKAMLLCLRQHYGTEGRSAVVPNGREMAFFSVGVKEPIILTAGRIWDEAKNLSTLEAITHELAWPVYVAGEDRHPDSGSKAECSSVCLLGRLSQHELAKWYSRASIYALPARYEPFGLTVLEAAFSGCALVLGDIPSLRETWEGAAIFVNPENPSELGKTLRSLIEDLPYRETMAKRAGVRALSFTPERMAQGYIEVYRELLSGAAKGSK